MTTPRSQTLLRIMGGAIARVPAEATAFRFRHAAAMVTLAAIWPDATDPRSRSHHLGPRLLGCATPLVGRWRLRQPPRCRRPGPGPGSLRTGTWERLVALKRRYDPTNLFMLNQNIPPHGGLTWSIRSMNECRCPVGRHAAGRHGDLAG